MLSNWGNVTTTLMRTQSERHMRYIRPAQSENMSQIQPFAANAAIDYAPSQGDSEQRQDHPSSDAQQNMYDIRR